MYAIISKYDPKNRDKNGKYLVDEWTDFSCLELFPDFTVDEYLAVEERYWLTLKSILDSLNITRGEIKFLYKPYKNTKEKKKLIEDNIEKLWFPQLLESWEAYETIKPRIGDFVSIKDIEALYKAALRDTLGIKIEFDHNSYLTLTDEFYTLFISDRDFSWQKNDSIFVEITSPPEWIAEERENF